MQSALEVFNYEGTRVRTVMKDGEVWFVAKDVCDVLELTNPTEAIRALDDDEKSTLRISEGTSPKGGNPNVNIINEPGLYALVFRSNKPEAKAFARWVRHEVLPQVMHTGSYNVQPSDKVNPLEGARYVCELAGITGNQLVIAVDNVYRRCTGFSALETAGITLIAPTQNQLLTPTEIGRLVGLSARRVNDLLAGAGYQHNIAGKWEAIEDGKQYGVLQDTGKRHSDGTAIRQLKWDSAIVGVVEELMRQAEEYPFAV